MAGQMAVLGSAVLALLLASYLAQQYLPMPTPRVIGIDLGTTYCSVGVFLPGSGDVKVIVDESGHSSIPSVVSFTDTGVHVGYEGLELADANPQNTIYDAKRFIGKVFTSEELQSESSRYPFKVVNNNGLAEFSVTTNETFHITPERIGSKLLLKLKKMAEANLGMSISKAVISVPAEFDERQRNSTIKAANLAGNNKLGGQDFNQRLMVYLYDQLRQMYGSLPTQKEEIHRLRQAVEAVKLNLTVHETATLRVLLTLPANKLTRELAKSQVKTNSALKDEASQNKKEMKNLGDDSKVEDNFVEVVFETEISRELFEMLNEDLFEKILVPIEQVLQEGHLHKAEVDEIVLVGGSTRIPKIREVIRDFFGKEPNTSVDPDLAVVTGVAIQAGILAGSWPLQVSAIEIPNKHLRKTNFN
ncbi:PREDICTED: heat shock 70 kDa protein 13 isoform X2 [Ficedula albicollis]|uniref:heat shock 70 kDa protein 13 isoform X2 n=1 Tax=Ficedula albicollis TaxID=59894 RepID=UPI00035A2C03|nr:PREDICTED: heat shock 70 kDa protein 13 isoform X2 [Ficedula albicollis]